MELFGAGVAVTVIGYALGSVPVANLVARRRAGTDLRAVGDRNPGWWNARHILGTRAAAPVFAGDVAKGALAATIGVIAATWFNARGDVDGEITWWLGYLGGGAAMVGHAFPFTAGFRGGRSVLTFVGAAAVLSPVAALIAIGVLVVVWALTARFDWAARFGVAVFPMVQILLDGPVRTAATGVLMTFIGLRFAQAALRDRRDASGSAQA